MRSETALLGRQTRRAVLAGGGALGVAAVLRPAPGAAQALESHGLSIFGDLKHPADFRHFDYVRPDAPKGGTFSHQISSTGGNQNFDTFNTLNIYVLKGDGAAGMGLVTDSLMVRGLDEPDAVYGLVARSVRRSPDGLTYTFSLRPEARFHDGSRLAARDVAFTFRLLKEKGHPRIAQTLRFMNEAVAENDETLRVTFAKERSRDLPLVVAGLPILSEAYWRGRDFEAATLEPPLGSGPYRVARFEVGRFIAFERVKDYWAAALPVVVGQSNFDEIRYEYFRDRQVAFEAFKAGVFTFREEFTARLWATGYDFPAVAEGKVRRETLPDRTPSGMQGWFFNGRRDKFKDARIREAIGLAFDFEWTNQTVMYGAYTRTASFFENSELKATGMPSPEEVALLEPFRGRVPDEVFGEPYSPPRHDGSGQDRTALRRANDLLREAGCRREGSQLKLASGEPFTLEFLDFQPSLQPHTQPFVRNLGLLGIAATIRIVDAAQYQRRTEEFDFDVVTQRYSNSSTPGEGLRQVFGSLAAATKGSQNLAGIADPVVDSLLETIVQAETRPALVAAVRALDRVLRAGRYWVPMWYRGSRPVAYWDMYGHPAQPPAYGLGAPDTWWYEPDKAKRIGRT
ncbi:MAG: extracellular solute-binding protein family 5 [Enterovirga sp.]|nr:extracellular solute-binding protein family 5 [Enterovirga sp.]